MKKVTLDYNPQIKSEVGPYPMRTTVVTLKDDRLEEKCYDIIIQVLDTNECEHSDSIEWAHQCDASSKCVNTEGSYFCACGGEYFLKRTAEYGRGIITLISFLKALLLP